MAKNYVQPGDVLDLVAPSGGVVSGQGYVLGALFVIALGTAVAGDPFRGKTCGVFDMPKAATVTPAQGAVVFFNNTTKTATGTTATGLFPIGVVVVAPAANDATVRVRLAGVPTAAAS